MKKAFVIAGFITLIFTFSTSAQNKKGSLPIAQILEADAKHNLNVAWQYFKLKKAYKAVLMRTEETLAAHPSFSRIDEVLYLSGMSSYYLLIGKGKQKIRPEKLSKEERARFAPKRLRGNAIAYLGILVEDHPDSKYKKKAEKTLKLLRAREMS